METGSQSITDHALLLRVLAEEGLEFLGVASADQDATDLDKSKAGYARWLSEGRHGTMAYLERHEAGKYDAQWALEGTRSVVVVGLAYYQSWAAGAQPEARVARYAWGRDYHKVLLKKLQRAAARLAVAWPEHLWRSFTDTAPLDERWWAAKAGASFTGRNTLSIHRKLGSWFLLGEILTTRAIEPTPAASHQHGSCPSGCRRCSQVCPTGALDTEGRIDASRCISYLTIEHRGPIADDLKPLMGEWIFGCDLCQEICPLNLGVSATQEKEFLAWKAGPTLDLAEVLSLTPESFTLRYGGSPVHRTGRGGLVRNACLVAANLDRRDLRTALEALVNDADTGVADAARWAVGRWDQGTP